MRQLGVIRDKQAFSAAEVAREEYFFCGPSPGMLLFIPCLSRMTSEISHGSLLTARFRTRLLLASKKCPSPVSLSSMGREFDQYYEIYMYIVPCLVPWEMVSKPPLGIKIQQSHHRSLLVNHVSLRKEKKVNVVLKLPKAKLSL